MSSSCTARQTISQLLRDIAKRDETIATLKRRLTHTLSSNSTSPIRPLSHDHVTDHTDAECGHMTELQSQVTRLEYETAKLRVELQNKLVNCINMAILQGGGGGGRSFPPINHCFNILKIAIVLTKKIPRNLPSSTPLPP